MSASPFLPFALHGATLALAWFFIVNVATSALVAGATYVLARRAPRLSAGVWFALRLLPAASAALFVAAMFLPSYWKYEPVDTEGFDVTLTICGAGAIAVLTAACVRGVGAWRRAAERTRTWMRTARPLQLRGTAITGFEIAADAPMMALAGVFRPRLFVTRGLIDALTPEELAASVAHEVGHSHGRDNLKRLLMRAAPDVFTSSRTARTLERSWAASAEHRADQLGSGADPSMRCALASALVKVARLRPSATPCAEPISTLVGGGDVASRVRSLLDAAPAPGQRHRRVTPLLTCASIVAAAAAYGPLLVAVHEATEALVRLLP